MALTVGTINPYRYKTYYYDIDTQLYYLQSRYYDAEVGRFVSADEPELLGVSGGVYSYNLYAYCEDDPVNNSDPNGTWVHILIGSIVGGIIGIITYFLTELLDAVCRIVLYGESFKLKVNGWKMLIAFLTGAANGALAMSGLKVSIQKNLSTFITLINTVVTGGTVLEIIIFTLIAYVTSSPKRSGVHFRQSDKWLQRRLSYRDWSKVVEYIEQYLKRTKKLYLTYFKELLKTSPIEFLRDFFVSLGIKYVENLWENCN